MDRQLKVRNNGGDHVCTMQMLFIVMKGIGLRNLAWLPLGIPNKCEMVGMCHFLGLFQQDANNIRVLAILSL